MSGPIAPEFIEEDRFEGKQLIKPCVRLTVILLLLGSQVWALTWPIVFVSRQIPPDGSEYMAAAKDMPGVGVHSRFIVAAPGKLQVLNPDKTVSTLIDGSNPSSPFIDVNAPAVSYDAKRLVFAGLPPPPPGMTYAAGPNQNPGAWRLYTLQLGTDNAGHVTGSNLTQITFTEPLYPTPTGLGGLIDGAINIYDDTDPAWLPDGRIVFTSTRFPGTGEYSGVRSSQLYVVVPDGLETGLHRITGERGAADRALVDPVTGKIVYSRWWRNNHFAVNSMDTIGSPGDYQQAFGVTMNQADEVGEAQLYKNLNFNMWQAGTINPDGTGLAAFHLFYRDSTENHYYGGAFTPSGDLIANFFPMTNLTEAAGFGGLRIIRRGASNYVPLIGINLATNDYVISNPCCSFGIMNGQYAGEPDVLPDNRIIFSLAKDTNQDYGLYTINPDGSGLTLIYDNAGTTELRVRVIAAKPIPPIIPDSITNVPSRLPCPKTGPYDQDGTFTFEDLNVYANGPVDMPIVNAIPIGSASNIRFYIHQQMDGVGSMPEVEWPNFLGTAPVQPDGSLINTSAPANEPLFEQIRDPNGLVPLTNGPYGVNGAAHVAGQNYGRPGSLVRCIGCHAGHSMLPVPTAAAAKWTNIATGGLVTASSIDTVVDPNTGTVPRLGALNDRLQVKQQFVDYWRSAQGDSAPWVQLAFPVQIVVNNVRLYDPIPSNYNNLINFFNIHMTSAQVVLYADANATQMVASASVGALSTTGTNAVFNNVLARSVRIYLGPSTGAFAGRSEASLGEIEVNATGDLTLAGAITHSPSAPRGLRLR